MNNTITFNNDKIVLDTNKLKRLTILEQHHGSTSVHPADAPPTAHEDTDIEDEDDDPNLTEQAPTTLLTPYPALVNALPGMTKDFFRNSLDDDTRRSFLHECPRNTSRQYAPPPLNDIEVSAQGQRIDRQLRDIQYRLSGLTRPIDLFVHDTIRTNKVDVDTALRFANTIHTLVSDVASFITQTRSDNICRDTGLKNAPANTPGSLPNAPLLDAGKVLEYTQLSQALRKAARNRSTQKNSGKSGGRQQQKSSDFRTTKQLDETSSDKRRGDSGNQSGFQKGKKKSGKKRSNSSNNNNHDEDQ
ncbi:hypothetical protein BDB00DRAFT_786225 [Zychaea mexicana]|uniref:uncharacterized protein n=1 Tax=Zychaea mexicana TaxID=64656 RepID=UPI0022FF03A1|nr:uncharacterized protein BDB00DRAFT_786225 [Zychaea mexicana]KAI9495715.1 hypothetical protein BDB00DRAFT_786225 [Zychaea mexicana]